MNESEEKDKNRIKHVFENGKKSQIIKKQQKRKGKQNTKYIIFKDKSKKQSNRYKETGGVYFHCIFSCSYML